MNAVVDRLIGERRADPEALATKHDLLNHMLTGVDKQTGEGLDDVNIRYQILTFLIAGHETTSGLLSFALYFLMKHPEALARAYDEVDGVLGRGPGSPPTHAQVHRLHYVQHVLKESLRLWPTAPAFAVYARENTTLGGLGTPVEKGQRISHPRADAAPRPDGLGTGRRSVRPGAVRRRNGRGSSRTNAFKPFGNGQRACIGQQFAMQEAALVLAMILRRFELIDHASYELKVKETLTLKPDGLTMKVRPRRRRASVTAAAATTASGDARIRPRPRRRRAPAGKGTPLLVLYGSNLGTAEGIAHRIAADGRAHGFSTAVAPRWTPTPATCRGRAPWWWSPRRTTATPPDNAARFCDWLRGLDGGPSRSGACATPSSAAATATGRRPTRPCPS